MNGGPFSPMLVRIRAACSTGEQRRRTIAALLAVLAGAALFAFSQAPAHAQPMARALVLPASADESAQYSRANRKPEVGVVRQKPVGIDVSVLDDTKGVPPDQLRVDLFDNRSVTIVRDRIERRSATSFTWHGKVSGHTDGFVLLTIVAGEISGVIDVGDVSIAPHRRYQIESTNDGLTLLREVDDATFPPDHPGGGEPVAPRATQKALTRTAPDKTAGGEMLKSDSGATIDVMVVYSNQTAAAAGTAIGAQIQQAVDTANLVYANSGITTRLRLVHYEQVDYNESGDFPTDLNRLTTAGDGYMDNVPALRDTYGADLVSLFVETTQYCGYGWIGPDPDYAFSVINRGCASGNYSYPHELGHNFGARHDMYVDSSPTPYAYGHGWVDVGERWRDVMAYNNACAAVGVTCTRIPYFSNPNQTYGSPADALGSSATADTVRVINQNAVTVANFRASVGSAPIPPATCTYSLSVTSASVPATGASGTDTLSTGSGCAWSASTSASWLAIASATSGTGSASVNYSAGTNTGATRSANLTIAGQTLVVTQAAATVGTTSPAVAGMSATSIAFGTVSVGKTSTAKSVTLTNSGGGTLTISSLAMGGANPGDFARSGTCAVNVMLSAGQSCTLGFTFSPTAIGTRSATLSVGTSDRTVTLGLSGSGKGTGHK
ncbi:MAG TPA: choice-of-anchor D domain-containing protein [Casimicrobiaceae bacterium]|nr:choice-of-anchor D domain-containing protein [Casimicrobiaceae bacterium]